MKNPNHPQKGCTVKVDPIIYQKDIKLIKNLLATKPRDLALFVLGINTNLRASDLVRITIGQVRGLSPMDDFEIKEKKTGKSRRVSLNASCIDAIRNVIESRPQAKDDEPLFLSSRGKHSITPITINALVKLWCRSINLKGNYGAHTLRKTWGYHQRVNFKMDIPTLMHCYGHASQKQTLSYLCIQDTEIKNVFANNI